MEAPELRAILQDSLTPVREDIRGLDKRFDTMDERLRSKEIHDAKAFGQIETDIENNKHDINGLGNKVRTLGGAIGKHVSAHWKFYVGNVALVCAILAAAKALNTL